MHGDKPKVGDYIVLVQEKFESHALYKVFIKCNLFNRKLEIFFVTEFGEVAVKNPDTGMNIEYWLDDEHYILYTDARNKFEILEKLYG